ncbi:MAG: hypothetical protein PHG98_01990 [Bacteroidales bacterium]|nr:hypothetical protein [Bacteroidales bacterium]MDD4067600.1 hypothetical protein [Bacteroidales bacterium]MDD4738700.1 hypothetical protein [Bacteroidales bacterium]
MKRRKLYILLLVSFIPQLIFSQSKEELNAKLNVICCDEGNIPELEIKYREIARELTKQDTTNIVAYNFLFRSFNARGEVDSIKILTEEFNKKIEKDHQRDIFYWLYPVRFFTDTNYIEDKLNFIDKNEKNYEENRKIDDELVTKLAENYYFLFMYLIKRDFKNDSIIKCAEKAAYYIHEAYLKDEDKYSAYIYPYIQLKYFLKEDIDSITNKYQSLKFPYYFPIIGFAEYPKDWLKDYRADLITKTWSFIFRDDWYSKHYKALKEERLYLTNTDKEIFRFVLLPTFDNPICVRVEKNNNEYLLTVKKTNGKGGYEEGKLVYKRKKKITEQQWNELMKMVNSINDWEVYFKEETDGGLDGSQWIFEHLSPEGYKIRDVWSPHNKFFHLGIFLFNLAGIKESIY